MTPHAEILHSVLPHIELLYLAMLHTKILPLVMPQNEYKVSHKPHNKGLSPSEVQYKILQ